MSDEAAWQRKCEVKDGKFVVPCKGLGELIQDNGMGRRKGVVQWAIFNRKVAGPVRTFIGAKSDARPDGLCFTYCPICGTDISAPFDKEEP